MIQAGAYRLEGYHRFDDSGIDTVAVIWRDANGREIGHETQSCGGDDTQSNAEAVALKLLRLGVTRETIKAFLTRELHSAPLDWTKVFQV